jgi:glycosyltransferase involved in cell wall biosynthesis
VRVVHVTAYYAPAYSFGGPPRSIHGLCKALIAAGSDVAVLTTDADGAGRLPPTVAGARLYDGVPVRYFPRSRPFRVIGSRALSDALAPAFGHADVVHIHGLWNRVVWAAARGARRAGVPYVLSPRGMLDSGSLAHHAWRKRLIYPLTDRATVQHAALIHATSESEAAGVRAWHAHARVDVIPNGVELSLQGADLSRADLGLPLDRDLIVAVARLHPIKRLDLLVDAFRAVRARRPNVHLVLAGPDEAGLWPGLRARSGHDADAVTWLGPVDEARRDALLRHAGVFALCSRSESFGMSLVEAMRAAVPVVVSDTCGWERIAGEGAGLVTASTAEALAEAMCRVLDDRGRAQTMGRAGQMFVRTHYAWSAVAPRYLAAYASLAGGARA